MPGTAELREKKSYWERRVWDLLHHASLADILVMSWGLEAIRTTRAEHAQRFLSFPGAPDDHKIGNPFFVAPWNIDAVINEKLLIPQSRNVRPLNLKNWPAVAKLMNTYNGLANIDGHVDIQPGGIIAAMPRLFWPQYNWQIGYDNSFRIGKAWHVYATPEGKAAFQEKHDVGLDDFLLVAFSAYAATVTHPAVKISYFDGLGFSRAYVRRCLSIISGSFAEQMRLASQIRADALPRDFKRSVVKERPLFFNMHQGEQQFYTPSREMLLLRITDGLYYDIVFNDNARRVSGNYFEELSYQVLNFYMGPTEIVEREKTTSYGVSADLFVLSKNNDVGLIVECKIRRIPQRVLSSPTPWEDYKNDFNDVIKGIVQIWRTNHELYAKTHKGMTGIVLQYEPWTLMGNAFIQDLFKAAHEHAQKLNIPESSRIPIALVGYPDLETCLRSFNLQSICRGVTLSIEEKFHGYQLYGIIDTFSQRKKKESFNYNHTASTAIPWWSV